MKGIPVEVIRAVFDTDRTLTPQELGDVLLLMVVPSSGDHLILSGYSYLPSHVLISNDVPKLIEARYDV